VTAVLSLKRQLRIQ